VSRYTCRMRGWILLSIPLLLFTPSGAVRAESRSYQVDSSHSTLRISVGKGGLFSFAGHEHEVVATRLEGRVVADEADLSRSTVALQIQTAGLEVAEEGEPPGDVPKVQEKMAGPEVLDVVRFPTVSFRSTAVRGKPGPKGGYELDVTGELSLHGVTKSLTLPVHVDLAEGSLTATGRTALRQTDYGMKPVSVAGVVKVKNELRLDFSIVARSAPD